jgi:hypothetical protein
MFNFMKKYIAILSVLFFISAGYVLAAQQEWTAGNYKYERTANGIKVTQIHAPTKNNSAPAQIKRVNPETAPAEPLHINITPQQQLNIVSANSIGDISVSIDLTAPLSDISALLPANASVVLSDNSTQSLAVVWDDGTPLYDANTAGTYVFSGLLTLPENITNTDNIKAAVNVVVAEPVPAVPPPSVGEVIQNTTEIIQITGASLLDSNGEFLNFLYSQFKTIGNIFNR